MFTLKILPSDKEITIDSESTILEALKENDVYIKSSCGGYASCGCCRVRIIDGKENLDKAGFPELQLLGNVFHITKERLACQTRVSGDVTLDTSVHDKEHDELAREMKTSKRPSKPPARPLVRKKEDVEKVKDDRAKEFQVQQKNNASWERHWEKKEENPELASKPKKLGGGKRPRPFSYKNDEVDFEQVKAENKVRGQANFEKRQDEEYANEGRNQKRYEGRPERKSERPESRGAKAAYNPPKQQESGPDLNSDLPTKGNADFNTDEKDFRKKRQQDDE